MRKNPSLAGSYLAEWAAIQINQSNCLNWRKFTAAPNSWSLTSLCGSTRHRWWASLHLRPVPTSRWTSLFQGNDIVSVWASPEDCGLSTCGRNQNTWTNWIANETEGFAEKGLPVPPTLGEKSSTSIRWRTPMAFFILTPGVWAVGQRKKQDTFVDVCLFVQHKQPFLTRPR